MIGKVWTLIIVISFITFIHHIQSECMEHDIEEHLINELMEDHVFEIKVFPSETKESKLLTVINTLCSYVTKNNSTTKFRVLLTFQIMLKNLDKNINLCATHTCMDAFSVRYVNKRTFRDMYLHSCNSSVSDLKCPSDSSTPFTTISSNDTAFKRTTFLTTVSSTYTAQDGSITSSTAVTPNFTATENQTIVDSLTTSSSPKESIYEKVIAENQNLQTTIKTMYAVLAVSLLLNVFLLLLHLRNCKKRGSQGTAEVNELSRLHSPLENTSLSDDPLPLSC